MLVCKPSADSTVTVVQSSLLKKLNARTAKARVVKPRMTAHAHLIVWAGKPDSRFGCIILVPFAISVP